MDIDKFRSILKKPEIYLPTIIIFWILNKTNEWKDLIALILAFIFLLYQDKIASKLARQVNKKEIEELLKKKKIDQALDSVVKQISPQVMKRKGYFGTGLVIIVCINLYAFYRIMPFWDSHIVKFLISIGGFAIAYKIGFYLRNFIRQTKAIIKEELYKRVK